MHQRYTHPMLENRGRATRVIRRGANLCAVCRMDRNCALVEPPRVCRRLFGLSQAALAMTSA